METNDVQKKEPVPIPLPNSNAILMLGIFSIVIAFCCGFLALIGLVLGIVALSLAPRAIEIYQANPSLYTESSFKNINAGKICAIIGIVVSGLIMLIGLIWMMAVGATLGTIFDHIPWSDYIN
jgi:uncharacterized Tic20 family protein